MIPAKPDIRIDSVTSFIMTIVCRSVSILVCPLLISGRGPAAVIKS